MSNNDWLSPHNLQKAQTAAAAVQVAQTAKVNRNLAELKQISAAQAQLAHANVRATQQVAAGVQAMRYAQDITNQKLDAVQMAAQAAAEASRKTKEAIEELNQEVSKRLDYGNEISEKKLIENKISNALQQIQIDNDSLRFEIESNERELDKLNKRHFSSMMEVIFNASEEIKEISTSEKHNIEIFFQLNSLIYSLKDVGVATDKVDDLDTKASISKLLNQTDIAMKDCLNAFNATESEDLADILDILDVDEEKASFEKAQKIKESKSDILAIDKNIKKLEKDILKSQNEIKKLRPVVIKNS
tara:strand:+ start:1751 stop:2656 length:906 start_codon:yes stop_codon:yes gene_type:complete